MKDVLKLLRYNTGNDKKSFVQFKDKFDAAIFNATIVAHSRAAVADIVSVHKQNYIIDPQTHIFQHNINAVMAPKGGIKRSVEKYLSELPPPLSKIITEQRKPLTVADVAANVDGLVESVYAFETNYIDSTIQDKDYGKYLQYAQIGPQPRVVIAPYFMLKKEYSLARIREWLAVNKECLEKFIKKNNSAFPVAAQLVIDQQVLLHKDISRIIQEYYTVTGCDYVFLWVDAFVPFEATIEQNTAFQDLLQCFTQLNIKPIMAYGGYDSIMLCNRDVTNRLYGVAQSVGYGEAREITPVGGGLPVNKYYFMPTHDRMRFGDAAALLAQRGYFDDGTALSQRTQNYYYNICSCKTCREVIQNDVNNFNAYNDSIPYEVNYKKLGKVERNRPTTSANLIAASHFMWCKVNEWKSVSNLSLGKLKDELMASIEEYAPADVSKYKLWCDIYAR